MSDEFGMTLHLSRPAPNWEEAIKFTAQITQADGDEEEIEIVAEAFLPDTAPDSALEELTGQFRPKEAADTLSEAMEILITALKGESDVARMHTAASGERIVAMEPNTGADAAVEAAWRNGSLAVAGFTT